MKIPVFHTTFESAGTQTVNLQRDPHTVLIKNMTDDKILVSWGAQIDPIEYIIIPTQTAELLEYSERAYGDLVLTIQAFDAGIVETRVIDD